MKLSERYCNTRHFLPEFLNNNTDIFGELLPNNTTWNETDIFRALIPNTTDFFHVRYTRQYFFLSQNELILNLF